MGEWIKENLGLYAVINFALCLIIVMVVVKAYADYRIDHRIIDEYQKPIVEKLDTLIKYYQDEREYRSENN